jgi:sugar phosphate permease
MSKAGHVMEGKVHEERLEQDELEARINALTPEEQKKLKRRIDRRLVLTLGTLYCVSLLDRNNLGIANIAGMGVDLQLTGPRYSTIALVFWVTYTLFQPAAVVIMRKIGPQIFLATICLLWGMVMICFGFVQSWSALVGLRVVLGVFEAGLVPGKQLLYSLFWNHVFQISLYSRC